MTDPIPYRLAVLKKLTEHLQGITPANGYRFDLSASVYRGIATFSDDPDTWPLPMVSILESTRPNEAFRGGTEEAQRADNWDILVQGWARDNPLAPTDDLYYLSADVEKRLGEIVAMREDGSGRPVNNDIFRLGPMPGGPGNTLVAGFKIQPPVVRPSMEQVSRKAFFYLPICIQLAYNSGNPYIAG